MNWHEHYDYKDGEIYRKNHKVKSYNGVKAGWIDVRGYVRTKLFSKMTFAHRVIWEMHNGDVPEGMEIDHINGVKHDNRIENLRCVDRFINCKNASMRVDNKTGVTGVTYNKSKNKFIAQMQKDGVRVNKSFEKLIDAKEYAESFYASNQEFTERHGK